MSLLGTTSAVLHVLVAATWFGAMAYSFAVLHPRAGTFFGPDAQGFETLMTVLAAGARWKVLGACGLLAVSGVGLTVAHLATTASAGAAWIALIWVKTGLFIATVALFCYVSWRMWPARVFAIGPEEVTRHQRRFRVVAVVLLGLVGTQIVLGVVAAHAD